MYSWIILLDTATLHHDHLTPFYPPPFFLHIRPPQSVSASHTKLMHLSSLLAPQQSLLPTLVLSPSPAFQAALQPAASTKSPQARLKSPTLVQLSNQMLLTQVSSPLLLNSMASMTMPL
jgi:hypothetical protein